MAGVGSIDSTGGKRTTRCVEVIRYKNYAGRVGRAEELRMEESCVASVEME